MTLYLPQAVATYFAISNGGEVSRLAACFSADAVVSDEKRTHRGLEAIEAWQREARQAFTYQVEPLEAAQRDERLIVTARVSGNFPGSPVNLKHSFEVKHGLILALAIAP